MNVPVYASSCPALQSNLSLHSSTYYNEYNGGTRRRLSSTGEADTSATSSYEGSDSSENSEETRLDPITQVEREQLETFFRGLKSQVKITFYLSRIRSSFRITRDKKALMIHTWFIRNVSRLRIWLVHLCIIDVKRIINGTCYWILVLTLRFKSFV